MKLPGVTELIARNRFRLDEEESHIEINQELAARTGTADRIIAVCPAGVYSKDAEGKVAIEYAACLECGTCLAVADPGTLTWKYPRGGFGIQFREG
jgi:ferredoxin like protein